MKVVQIGILIALIVVGVLLFKTWRGQQQQALPEPVAEQAQPAPSDPATTAITEEAQQAPVAQKAEPRPSPAWKPAPKPAAGRTEEAAAKAVPSTPAPTVTPPPAVTPAPASSQAPPASVTAEKSLPPPPPRKVTIEAGTLISVRLAETLDSDRIKAGDTFTATLDRPLVVDELVIAERGARLEGRVVEAQQAGRVKGVAELAIHLVRLRTSDGQNVALETEVFRKEGPTTKKEDAAKVGAGAGIGAAIGAIAGGGKGAAIGAAVGGAAGAGTVAATRGKPAVLPTETRIDFRLNAPVTLTERTR